ncbi:quinate permease [Anopheles sinensis]|uniref:Quinate permease n=1 Tax=Anopheles sinensis TaxID=74873 RepID=A0A084VKU0_ANOSI|nr:quinate permease [Anopheles sinensis]
MQRRLPRDYMVPVVLLAIVFLWTSRDGRTLAKQGRSNKPELDDFLQQRLTSGRYFPKRVVEGSFKQTKRGEAIDNLTTYE